MPLASMRACASYEARGNVSSWLDLCEIRFLRPLPITLRIPANNHPRHLARFGITDCLSADLAGVRLGGNRFLNPETEIGVG